MTIGQVLIALSHLSPWHADRARRLFTCGCPKQTVIDICSMESAERDGRLTAEEKKLFLEEMAVSQSATPMEKVQADLAHAHRVIERMELREKWFLERIEQLEVFSKKVAGELAEARSSVEDTSPCTEYRARQPDTAASPCTEYRARQPDTATSPCTEYRARQPDTAASPSTEYRARQPDTAASPKLTLKLGDLSLPDHERLAKNMRASILREDGMDAGMTPVAPLLPIPSHSLQKTVSWSDLDGKEAELHVACIMRGGGAGTHDDCPYCANGKRAACPPIKNELDSPS
jgi:hypothetical protein